MSDIGTGAMPDRAARDAQNASYAEQNGYVMMSRSIVGDYKAELYNPTTGTFIDLGADGVVSADDKTRSIDSLTCTEKVNLCQASRALSASDLSKILDAGNDRLDQLITGYRDGSLNPESGQDAGRNGIPPRDEALEQVAAVGPTTPTPSGDVSMQATPTVAGAATDEPIFSRFAPRAAHFEAISVASPAAAPATAQGSQWMNQFLSWLMQNPSMMSMLQASVRVQFSGV